MKTKKLHKAPTEPLNYTSVSLGRIALGVVAVLLILLIAGMAL